MKIVSKNKVISIVPLDRQNVDLSVLELGEYFSLTDDAPFAIFVTQTCKLKVRTCEGTVDVFDFLAGDDSGFYDRVYKDAENTIEALSIRK
jgi:hypothetical protein